MNMTETDKTKKQLIIFLLVTYGVTCLMGILIWYGSTISAEMGVFPIAQMHYPAAGVMLAYLLTRWEDSLMPRWFYLFFIILTIGQIALSVLSIVMPGQMMTVNGMEISAWGMISQYVIIGVSILCWFFLLAAGKKRRGAYGLSWKCWKASVLCICLFVGLYFGRAALSCAISGQMGMLIDILTSPVSYSYMLLMPINFFLAFVPFFGEEYGWRYYFQPILQKRFGMRRGVLILGVVWGLWHIFLDFFYYTTPDRGLAMTGGQMITCVFLGIFFAWAYMKTGNIWVPVILHFINNNIAPVMAGNYSMDGLENQQITWAMIPEALLINGIVFGFFLLSKEFRKKEVTEE